MAIGATIEPMIAPVASENFSDLSTRCMEGKNIGFLGSLQNDIRFGVEAYHNKTANQEEEVARLQAELAEGSVLMGGGGA